MYYLFATHLGVQCMVHVLPYAAGLHVPCVWTAWLSWLYAHLGRGSSKATGLHGFSWMSYSSLPFPQTQLPSAAGAESEWPPRFTPEVASFQLWVSDPSVCTLSNLGDPSA